MVAREKKMLHGHFWKTTEIWGCKATLNWLKTGFLEGEIVIEISGRKIIPGSMSAKKRYHHFVEDLKNLMKL